MLTDAKIAKVLIATDGSHASFGAVADLVYAGLPDKVECVVIAVADQPIPIPRSFGMVDTNFTEVTDNHLQSPRFWARSAGDIVRHHFPDWTVTEEIRIGSVAREIIKYADDWKPDLIVIGSHGRSALGRLFFGSISQKIVTEAHGSVRVGRRRVHIPTQPIRIIVAVDDTPQSKSGLATVMNRNFPAGTEVKLVTATGVFDYYATDMFGGVNAVPYETVAELRKTAVGEAQKIQAEALEPFADSKLNVSCEVFEGDPKTVLLTEAERWQADAIVLGSRGLSGMDRFLLGSVSAAVVARAHCSVEIIRS